MEEDINILEKFTKIVKGKDYNAKNGWHGYYDDELIVLGKTIENLIKGYRELEEENELYKLTIGEPPLYKSEIVPKSKIKEKIEELENIFDMGEEWYTKQYIVELLQELMEDK